MLIMCYTIHFHQQECFECLFFSASKRKTVASVKAVLVSKCSHSGSCQRDILACHQKVPPQCVTEMAAASSSSYQTDMTMTSCYGHSVHQLSNVRTGHCSSCFLRHHLCSKGGKMAQENGKCFEYSLTTFVVVVLVLFCYSSKYIHPQFQLALCSALFSAADQANKSTPAAAGPGASDSGSRETSTNGINKFSSSQQNVIHLWKKQLFRIDVLKSALLQHVQQ